MYDELFDMSVELFVHLCKGLSSLTSTMTNEEAQTQLKDLEKKVYKYMHDGNKLI